jgi:hypothetical protein
MMDSHNMTMDGVTFDTDGAGTIDAFWTESRIDPATVPEGWHRYSVRGGEDGWEPCSIEDHVTVNHTADILIAEDLGPLLESGDGMVFITDWWFNGGCRTFRFTRR